MRKNIFDLLSTNFDIADETLVLSTLLNRESFRYNGYSRYKTLEEFVDTYLFSRWKAKGRCINCTDMKRRLKLNNDINVFHSFEESLIFLEYISNLLYIVLNCKNSQTLHDAIWHIRVLTLPIRESTDSLGSSFDFTNQPLNCVVSTNSAPMLGRKIHLG